MKNLERLFAEKLLKIKAIKLQPANPFTWASGWKSPFYCDNRKTLSYPSLRSFVKFEITRLILERFGQVDAIAGVALVELAWRFYSKGNRHEIFRHFFEKISEACSRWVNKN